MAFLSSPWCGSPAYLVACARLGLGAVDRAVVRAGGWAVAVAGLGSGHTRPVPGWGVHYPCGPPPSRSATLTSRPPPLLRPRLWLWWGGAGTIPQGGVVPASRCTPVPPTCCGSDREVYPPVLVWFRGLVRLPIMGVPLAFLSWLHHAAPPTCECGSAGGCGSPSWVCRWRSCSGCTMLPRGWVLGVWR